MALAGIAYFDRRAVSEADSLHLGARSHLEAHSSRHPLPGDKQSIAIGAGVACAASHVLRDESGRGVVFGWDGRLDDRPAASMPDELRAFSVYRSQGVPGFRCLVGDWSLALWEAETGELILASDYAGVRPLYYHATPERVVWSSSLQQLTSCTGLTALCPNYAADFLSGRPVVGCTPIAGIAPVPPGCALRIGPGGVKREQFWHPPLDTHIRYNDEREYEEHLRVLFEDAVASRLRDSAPVCAELSGGLDSSSIVCQANSLFSGQSVGATRLVAFSYRGIDPSDQPFWREIERSCQLATHQLEIHRYPFAAPDQVGKGAPLAWEPRFAELRRQMLTLGSNMLLTGRMGDLVMGNWFDGGEQICESASLGHWKSALADSFRWSHSQQLPLYTSIQKAWSLSKASWTSFSIADSLTPSLRQLAHEREERAARVLPWKSVAVGRRDRLHAVLSLLESRALECPETMSGVSCSHPFAHLPLVEFMLKIPASVVYRPSEPRRLMKRAFSKLLPPRVLQRRSKASYTADFQHALRPMAGQLLRGGDPRVCSYGYVDAPSLRSRLQRFIDGLECGENQLRNILLFEFWLRSREQSKPHGSSPVPISREVAGAPVLAFQN